MSDEELKRLRAIERKARNSLHVAYAGVRDEVSAASKRIEQDHGVPALRAEYDRASKAVADHLAKRMPALPENCSWDEYGRAECGGYALSVSSGELEIDHDDYGIIHVDAAAVRAVLETQ